MLSLPASARVYLASEPVDMRRGHDGLFAIVKSWGLDPFNGDLFGFIGRRLDRAKILVWHRGGFVLLYKRLEKGRFRIRAQATWWPSLATSSPLHAEPRR